MKKKHPKYNILNAQLYHMNLDKLIEEEKIGQKLDQEFILKWIEENASDFRYNWNKSLCSKCFKNNICGYRLKQCCEESLEYEEYPTEEGENDYEEET